MKDWFLPAIFIPLYPIVTITLSYFFLHETITLKEGIGMIFALVAIILFSTYYLNFSSKFR